MKDFNKLESVVRFFATALAFSACAAALAQQDFPNRPIKLVVPFTAGSSGDTVARPMANEMSKTLGQPVVLDFKPGANGVIGIEYVLNQPADGYTIALSVLDIQLSFPATMKETRFDPIKDMPPFAGIIEDPRVIGSSTTMPWKNFDELTAAVKASPGKLNWASSNSLNHMLMEVILRGRNLSATRIPFQGGPNFAMALMTGKDVQFGLQDIPFAVTSRDKFNIFAVTGAKRNPNFPDVPTFTELGFPQIPGILFTLNARPNVPKPIIDKLRAAAVAALQQPAVLAAYAGMNMDIANLSQEQLARSVVDRAKLYMTIAKQIGFQPE